MIIRRDIEDFPSIDAAKAALVARGFKSVSIRDDCYRLPDRDKDSGYYQMADVFVPFNNVTIGRVAYWPSR